MSQKNQKTNQSSTNPDYTGIAELIATETGLINYSRSIVKKFYKKMNLHPSIKLCEFGAGTGFLADIFRSEFQIEPECIELDPKLMSIIASKQFTCFQFLSDSNQKYEAIYTSNVLEHIENDSAILEELFDSLIPGGVLGIYVPAHPILYSKMDKEIGHVRRYTSSELKSKVLTAGFIIESISYDEFIGFFASAFVKIVGYKNRANLGSKSSLIFYDKIIYPISRMLDFVGLRYLVGKNLILIATKPN